MEAQHISLESEAGFRVLFECATISILVMNEQGNIELSNPCADALFGYETAELIGRSIEVLIPQNLRHKHVHHREKYFEKPKARPMGLGMDLKGLKKDGTEFPVEISLGHYWLGNQQLAVAFVTDITQRKIDEESIRAREAMLTSEEASLIYLNKASNVLWQINSLEKGLHEILNASIELLQADKGDVQMLQASRKVLTIVAHKGFTQDFLDYFQEVSADDDSACGRALLTRRQVVIEDIEEGNWSAAFRAIARKAGFRSVISTPLFKNDGTPIGMISTHFNSPRKFTIRDLNRMQLHAHNAESFIERHKMLQELQESNALLERKVEARTLELLKSLEREKEMNELKSRFVSMASHEFRTPLSVVLSSSALIEQYNIDNQDARIEKHLGRIRSSVGNLTNILNDFLSLDKLEQGKIELDKNAFNLAEFMRDVIEEVQAVRKKGQRVDVAFDGASDVLLDQKKLRYILVNLLSNSIKYSPDESTIRMSAQLRDTMIIIAVQDNGIGIPEDEQKYMYSKFFRAKNTGNIQGTGLGLTIVKRYVELMGGNISFTSEVGKGTTFTISLPNNN